MKTFMKIGLSASLVAFTIADATLHAPIQNLGLKRAFLTCQQTYKGGSTTCGGPESHFCYDPTLGESCCMLDNGYCKAGDFCAPVAGYCCHNGEDPSNCAARESFTLPPFFVSATATTIASLAPTEIAAASTTVAVITSTVEVLVANSSTPTPVVAFIPIPVAVGAQISTTTSAGAMTPDFIAPLNQTAPSATVIVGLGAGVVEFTGDGKKLSFGVGVCGLLGLAAFAGMVL